jgi:putative FmdB family regulatory protein
MPLYDYDCPSCGSFSALRPLAEFASPGTCPQCGSTSPKALTSPAFHGATKRQMAYDADSSNSSQHVTSDATRMSARHGLGCSCCKASSAFSTTS